LVPSTLTQWLIVYRLTSGGKYLMHNQNNFEPMRFIQLYIKQQKYENIFINNSVPLITKHEQCIILHGWIQVK
jgi:hypothetical protein